MDRGFEIVTPLLLPEAHIYVSGGEEESDIKRTGILV